jgi:uncharacterized coiled-coil protein SlyX
MLEHSFDRIEKASAEQMQLAEEMALATMVADFEEDLIPRERAWEITLEHRAAHTEDWLRAVNAALASLTALNERGYSIRRN